MPAEGLEPADIRQERARAWWIALLAGQPDQPHPRYGHDLRASIVNGILTLKGILPTRADRARILAEARGFRKQGISEVRDEIEVSAAEEQEGVLSQTMIGVFESEEQARFAMKYLESHYKPPARPPRCRVLGPETQPAELRKVLPGDHVEEARQQLTEGHTLLVVTVDETDAFKARQFLDEETRSLRTIVLPPRPASPPPAGRHRP
jgi:hypothetical protein